MEESLLSLQKITPQVVRSIFKNNLVPLDIADKVLEYCCSDEDFADLVGVQVLRVGEEVISFQEPNTSPYFCMSQRESDLLCHFDSLSKVRVTSSSDIIRKIITSGQTNVVSITTENVASELQSLLQKQTKVTEEFLVEFFTRYYSTLSIYDRRYFNDLELVPIVNSRVMAAIGDRRVLHDKENYVRDKVLRDAIISSEVQVLNSTVVGNDSVAYTLQLDQLTVASFLEHSTVENVQGLNDDEKKKLLDWIIQHFDQMCFKHCNKLFTFPIFRMYKRTARYPISLQKNFLRPLNIPEDVLTNVFVHIGEYSQFYKDTLKVLTMTEADFYVNVLFPKIQNEEEEVTKCISELLVSTLRRVGTLQEQNRLFKEELKTIKFVKTRKPYVMVALTDLYDPRDSDLVTLFDLDKFPKQDLQDYYDHMVDCGMSKVMQCQHLELVMKEIHQKMDVDKAKTLLLYLSKIINIENLESWKNALLRAEKNGYLWIPNTSNTLSTVQETRPKKDEKIVATVKKICNVKVSKAVKILLGWDKSVDIACVVTHLRNVVTSGFTSDVSYIYTLLEKELLSDELVREICSFNSVLVDNKFVSPAKLQLEKLNTNLEPLLFSLPESFATKYRTLTRRLSIPLRFSNETLIAALNTIKERAVVSLSEEAIGNAVAILEIIAKGTEEVDTEILPVPTTENRFDVAANLYYIDPTAPQQHLTEFHTRRVHKKIIFDVAKKLGVRSLVAYIAKQAECKFVSEDFGQKERLIDRIKGILKKYPHERSNLFLEMLQNANDAGATKLHIIYDTTKYKTKNLLHDHMTGFQGPSLLIYNDAVFKDEDFSRIQHIASGEKLAEMDKIGRFGLGFNTCYWYTDLPSVVSRDRLAFFDPHAEHLPNSNVLQPGRMYRFLNQSLVDSFPEQFEPYMQQELGCTMREEFNGTLFRLPLRTTNQVARSKIAQLHWPCDKIEKMLEQFMVEAPECLLFLQHVNSVRISVKENGECTSLFHVEAERSAGAGQINNHVIQCINELKSDEQCSTNSQVGQVTLNTLRNNHMTNQDWLISSVTGGTSAARIAEQQRNNNSYRFVPHGSVAMLKGDSTHGKLYTFIPLPIHTGLNFHINGYFEVDESRQNMYRHQMRSETNESLQVKWNTELMRSCLAPAAANLMEHLASEIMLIEDELKRKNYFDRLMQQVVVSSTTYPSFVEAMLQCLASKKIFYHANSLLSLNDIIITGDTNLEQQVTTLKHATNIPVFIQPNLSNALQQHKIQHVKYEPRFVRVWLSNYFADQQHRVDLIKSYIENKNAVLKFVQEVWRLRFEQPFLPNEHINLPVTTLDENIAFLGRKHVYVASPAVLHYLETIVPNMKSLFISSTYAQNFADNDLHNLKILKFNIMNDLRAILTTIPQVLTNNKRWFNALWELLQLSQMTAEQVKQALSGLKVIPTTRDTLVSVSQCTNVYSGSQSICEVLNALEAHVAHPDFTKYSRLLSIITAIDTRQDKFAEVLYKLYTNHARFENLSIEHLSTIRCYYNKKQIDLWKHLPIYGCTNNQRISLTKPKSKMFREPRYSIQLPVAVNNIFIIKQGWEQICDDLEIPHCNDIQIFKSCYIPEFSSYTEDEQTSIMDYFRKFLSTNKEILELIKSLPFVGGRRVSELYDSTDDLFTLFLPKDQFPQGVYADKKWKSILQSLGLRYYYSISEKERKLYLLSCCSKLEVNNRNQLSILLLRTASEPNSTVQEIMRYNLISVQDLSDILYPGRVKPATNQRLESITRCVSAEYKNICFTTKFIVEPRDYIFSRLCETIGQTCGPSVQDVIEHLTRISAMTVDQLQEINAAHGTNFIQTMVNEAYKFLSEIIDQVQILPSVRIIYLIIEGEGRFVAPEQCFWNLEQSYAPHLYQLPEEYINQFRPLFNKFGVCALPSAEFSAKTLLETYRSNQGEQLNPVLTDLCLYLIRHLVTKFDATLEAEYVLTESLTLAPHSRVRLHDAPYLINCVNCELFEFLHHDLIDLSRKLKLVKFSSVVREELANNDVEESQNEVTIQITRAVTSTQFQNSILRLVNHESNDEKQDVNLQTNLLQLQHFTAVTVNRITLEYFDENNVNISKENSASQLCSFDKSNQKIYLLSAMPSNTDPYVEVAGCINRYLCSAVQDSRLLVQLLKCSPEEMEQALTNARITLISNAINRGTRVPGCEIDDEKDRLWFNCAPEPTISLEKYKLVGYVQNDRLYYGRIVEKQERRYIVEAGERQVVIDEQNIRVHREIEIPRPTVSRQQATTLEENLTCPISRERYVDPVMAADGFTYEREHIQRWIQSTGNPSSPMLGTRLANTVLIPNTTLRTLLRHLN
jgi:hypothetical protein